MLQNVRRSTMCNLALERNHFVSLNIHLRCKVLAVIAIVAHTLINSNAWAETGKRSSYDHVFRVTALLEFDGQSIKVDDLIDCRTNYTGPANRAVTLPFETSRWQLPYATDGAGVLIINIMPNTCGAYAKKWSGVADVDAVFPDGWVPFMHWYNTRDPLRATFGEYFWSQTALEAPSGRLKIVENFQILYPDQSDETNALAARQVVERDVWTGEKPRLNSALFLPKMPVYYRLPRVLWANEPAYQAAPDRLSDVAGLRAFLDQQPKGDGLVYLGEDITANKAWAFSVDDHLWGRRGGSTDGWHGVPHGDQPRWAMFLSKRGFEKVQTRRQRVAFRDAWVPTELVDGTLTLRPEKTGTALLGSGYGDWYRAGARQFKFMDKSFVNGPYSAVSSLYIFDLETRDLWVQD
ncbi:MAG: hypothetical protein AAGK03_10515 [Pseudomonadota bacterium]